MAQRAARRRCRRKSAARLIPMPDRICARPRRARKSCRAISRSNHPSSSRAGTAFATPWPASHLPTPGGFSMRKFLPVLFSGLLAVSFSQLAAAQSTSAQGDTKASGSASVGTGAGTSTNSGSMGGSTSGSTSDKSSASGSASTGTSAGAGATTSDTTKAGPTDNPNVSKDATGRTHTNKGKHKGERKNKKDKDQSSS